MSQLPLKKPGRAEGSTFSSAHSDGISTIDSLIQESKSENIGRPTANCIHDLNNIFNSLLLGSSVIEILLSDENGILILASMTDAIRRGADIIKEMQASSSKSQSRNAMNDKPLILIADDDIGCQTTMAALLTNHGYRCDCASTGEEALSLLKRNRYDLLLSDIKMPGNQDLQLIEVLPQMQKGLPVILMTGYPSIQTAAQSVGLAVSAYLIKPIIPEALLAEAAQAIERARCYRTIAGSRERLTAACEDLKRLGNLLPGSAGENKTATLMAFLDLTIQTIAGSLLDLKDLIETLSSNPEKEPELDWLATTRPMILIAAIREAIAVLAKTKGSFKSRELADLRRKLETLLQVQSGGDKTIKADAQMRPESVRKYPRHETRAEESME